MSDFIKVVKKLWTSESPKFFKALQAQATALGIIILVYRVVMQAADAACPQWFESAFPDLMLAIVAIVVLAKLTAKGFKVRIGFIDDAVDKVIEDAGPSGPSDDAPDITDSPTPQSPPTAPTQSSSN